MNDAELSQASSERMNAMRDDELTAAELATVYAVRYTVKRHGEWHSNIYRTLFLSPEEAQSFINGDGDYSSKPAQSWIDAGFTDPSFSIVTMVECPF